MISIELIFYLSIGAAVMLIPILIQSIWYHVKWYKGILITILLTVAGTVGAYTMFFVENHWIGGTSFYGAVFLVPVLFLPLAKLLRMPYGTLMDLCGPAECVMLAIMKVQCLIGGCCGGRECSVAGVVFRFPSQIAELTNALVIMVVLMLLARKKNLRGFLYPCYMLLYGLTRFVLNFFRGDTSQFALGLTAGSFWSVCSVIIAVITLVWMIGKRKFKESKIDHE